MVTSKKALIIITAVFTLFDDNRDRIPLPPHDNYFQFSISFRSISNKSFLFNV